MNKALKATLAALISTTALILAASVPALALTKPASTTASSVARWNPPIVNRSPVPIPNKIFTFAVCCDSITAADGGELSSYRNELRDLLKTVRVEARFVVVARGGSWCSEWTAALPDAVVANPDIDFVLINCGTNDATATVADRDKLRFAYQTMLEQIHNRSNAKIMGSLIQISREPDWLRAQEIRANEVIGPLVQSYIAVSNRFALADMSVIPATVENNPDGIHPGPAGEALYAKIWFDEGHRLGWW